MTEKQDGGRAFPHPGTIGPADRMLVYPELGMTLRDWFATHAPKDHVEFEGVDQMLEFLGTRNVSPRMTGQAMDAAKVRAKLAYIYADAMLAERSKP